MASLNLSQNGPSISKSYQSVVDAPLPSGAAASSPTYGQWAVFSVAAPLANAFADSGSKESVLKVKSTGEGELVDFVDEFEDGRIQFAFLKVRDPNSGLPKNALIAWCGEGVPERTKGYFTSHMTAVAKLLHGYHVQITARSERDLNPDSIVQKVADASGSKYSTSSAPQPSIATKPIIATKPVFTPTQSSAVPIRQSRRVDPSVDADGWGADAPPVTRTQLEKVSSAYKPTKVDMRALGASTTNTTSSNGDQDDRPGVVKGAYQPVGKVDIAEIRRRAKESGELKDDRPELVKGSYEPVGKVDIAAIRGRAQKPEDTRPPPLQEEEQSMPSLAQRSAAFSSGPERLTSLPKPKVANKFGTSASSFTGTKAPLPGNAAPVSGGIIGSAGRSLAESAGKTPAQLWAEKKARERGASGSGTSIPAAPLNTQTSGNEGWKSDYAGKKWAPVQTNRTGSSGIPEQHTGGVAEEEEGVSSVGGINSIRDRFNGAAPMGAPASYDRAPPSVPEPETSTKPNRGVPIPGLSRQSANDEETNAGGLPPPPVQARSPTPTTPEREESPIRVARPISNAAPIKAAHEEPPALPSSLGKVVSQQSEVHDDEPDAGPDPGRHTAQVAAASAVGGAAVAAAGIASLPPVTSEPEKMQAIYEYAKTDTDEVELQEGEIVTDIEKVDENWWMVTNAGGERGLVPSSYLGPVDGEPAPAPTTTRPEADMPIAHEPEPEPEDEPEPAEQEQSGGGGGGGSAKALYDYEAGEDNEISFPEGAIIMNISFPDSDWWLGEYRGKSGLFPANYVELDE